MSENLGLKMRETKREGRGVKKEMTNDMKSKDVRGEYSMVGKDKKGC